MPTHCLSDTNVLAAKCTIIGQACLYIRSCVRPNVHQHLSRKVVQLFQPYILYVIVFSAVHLIWICGCFFSAIHFMFCPSIHFAYSFICGELFKLLGDLTFVLIGFCLINMWLYF